MVVQWFGTVMLDVVTAVMVPVKQSAVVVNVSVAALDLSVLSAM